jgi:hypothetical protein
MRNPAGGAPASCFADQPWEQGESPGVCAETVALSSTPHSFWLFGPWLTATVDAMADFLGRMVCGSPDE